MYTITSAQSSRTQPAMTRSASWDISPMAGKSPARVLVVDDEPLIRWSLTELLRECGCEVAEAGDAVSALAAIRDGFAHPDVVVADLRLPDTDDLGFVAAVRKASPEARIVLMTAFGTPEILREARSLGVFQVVQKPFEMQEMLGVVRDAHRANR